MLSLWINITDEKEQNKVYVLLERRFSVFEGGWCYNIVVNTFSTSFKRAFDDRNTSDVHVNHVRMHIVYEKKRKRTYKLVILPLLTLTKQKKRQIRLRLRKSMVLWTVNWYIFLSSIAIHILQKCSCLF